MNIKRKISFYLQKIYASNSREAQIRMRVRWSGNILQFNVGYNVLPEKWDRKSGRCKKGITNQDGYTAFEINKEISRLEVLADDIFKPFEVSGYEPSSKEYKNTFNTANGKCNSSANEDSITIQKAFTGYMLEMSHKKSWESSTVIKHNTIKNILSDYNHKWKVENISRETLSDYYNFLLKRMRNSSIKKHISFLQTFFRWCNEKDYLKSKDWEKFKLEIKTIRGQQLVFLTWDELMKIYDLKFPKDKKYLEHARDIFCFQCFTSLRFSDVYKLKRTDVFPTCICVCTEKTDTELTIELNKYSKAILDKYKDEDYKYNKALPVPSNQKLNEYIKEVCYIAEFNTPITKIYYKGNKRIEETYPKYKLIGSHTGRRTFICNALMLGISPEIVMKWTGHSNYKAMQPYIDVAAKDKEKAMKLFNR